MQRKNNPDSSLLLSVIIPAYKMEKTIYRNIRYVENALSHITNSFEIIIVVDGEVDKTLKEAKKAISPHVKVVSYEKNQGKGYAVKLGVKKAKGDIIGFIDGGMDLNAENISLLLEYMNLHDADIVIGSKLHPDSEVHYPFLRHVLSYGYRLLTRILFNLSVKDTQVGLKLFRKEVAKDIFPRNLVKQFAFDVETLALAQTLGYTKIYEAPVKLDFKGGASSITNANFWKVSFRMLLDTFGIFYRLKIKKTYRKSS